MVCGGLLGFERSRKLRPAGVRTYALVCLGAALTMMTSQFLGEHMGFTLDPTRMGAQVVSGIGFIGAGTILVTGHYRIKGLTTAAGLWAAACMGLAIGAGFYFGAVAACLSIIVVLALFDWMQAGFQARSKRLRLYVLFDALTSLHAFTALCRESGLRIQDFETVSTEGEARVGAIFTLQSAARRSHDELIALLRDAPGVQIAEEL